MSPRMVRMLKWLATHDVAQADLGRANQCTLRGLALRGLVSRGGITHQGMQELSLYSRSEFISRKKQGDLSAGVAAALRLVRIRKEA